MNNNSTFAKFSLRSGTDVRVHELSDCRRVASLWPHVQHLDHPGRELRVEDYAVVAFTLPHSKLYAITRRQILPLTVSDLKNKHIHDGLWRADALFFRGRFYYYESEGAGASFLKLLEAAVDKNTSPYLVPLL
jgi:hypothetical protein